MWRSSPDCNIGPYLGNTSKHRAKWGLISRSWKSSVPVLVTVKLRELGEPGIQHPLLGHCGSAHWHALFPRTEVRYVDLSDGADGPPSVFCQ